MGASASIAAEDNPSLDPDLVAGRREVYLALTALHASARNSPKIFKPVTPHAERVPSEQRGLSVEFLHGFVHFLRGRHADEDASIDVVVGGDPRRAALLGSSADDHVGTSVLELTRSTGLSLVESVLALAGVAKTGGVVGRATTYVSHAWHGGALSDLVSAVVDYDREQLRADRAAGEAGDPEPPPRFYWIDAFCASQVSIAGVPLTTK